MDNFFHKVIGVIVLIDGLTSYIYYAFKIEDTKTPLRYGLFQFGRLLRCFLGLVLVLLSA